MKRSKILFYISTIRGGGAARVMVNIANGLYKKGFDICFVTNFRTDHEYQLSNNIHRLNLEETERKDNILIKNMHRIAGLRKIICEEKPAVSISFMGENNFRLIPAAFGLPTKTILSVRNDPNKEYGRKGNKTLANLLFAKADGIVFQTEEARAFFSKRIQKKSRIIFNQVDDRFFQRNFENGKYIVACGRLSKQKNYPMMLQAFSKVLKFYPNEKLLIYGEGELREELENLKNDLGIDNAVEFMGFSTNMPEVYRGAKMLIMTSDYEGMPNAMLEALASSVPVISTDCPCGGPRIIIRNKINGYLVPVGDADAFAETISTVLADSSLLKRLKEGACESSQQFQADYIINDWLNYIIEVKG